MHKYIWILALCVRMCENKNIHMLRDKNQKGKSKELKGVFIH